MNLLNTKIEGSYKTLEMYYLQGIRNDQFLLATYMNSDERKQIKILGEYLSEIDIFEDFEEEYIFLWFSSYDEVKLYLDVEEIKEELEESYDIYKNFYKILDIVILKKWGELKKDLCD